MKQKFKGFYIYVRMSYNYKQRGERGEGNVGKKI